MLTDPREGIKIGSIYKRDFTNNNIIYLDDLENLIKSKTENGNFEYPEIKYGNDSIQINDSSDFSNTEIKVKFFSSMIIEYRMH